MTHTQAVNTGAAERYLLDEMSELERYAFEQHYFSCAECAEDVRAGGMLREGVKAGLVEAPGAMPRSRTWRSSALLPWAVAATLAVAVAYQSMVRVPGPALEPQALAPVTLRPASRGAEAIVRLTPGATAVTLAVDVNATRPGELTFDLRTADGTSVASDRAQAPGPGAPLLLLVPSWTLRSGEHYILSVRHAASTELFGEFRFGVAQ